MKTEEKGIITAIGLGFLYIALNHPTETCKFLRVVLDKEPKNLGKCALKRGV